MYIYVYIYIYIPRRNSHPRLSRSYLGFRLGWKLPTKHAVSASGLMSIAMFDDQKGSQVSQCHKLVYKTHLTMVITTINIHKP